MKITLDTKDLTCKVGSKEFGVDLPVIKEQEVISALRNFLLKNTKLTDYEMDSMWMSYRYCVGRHTIASHMHAHDIWINCKNRMSPQKAIFTAYDINREIEQIMRFGAGPNWHFPITSLNKIYTSAIDIFCEFLEEYNIKSKEEYLKYRDINIILCDNERGYKFETITWEEWLRPQVKNIVSKFYDFPEITEDAAWKYFETWKNGQEMNQYEMIEEFKKLTKDIPNPEYFYFSSIEDLFVWNDLVHAFDWEHHHKSVLTDGTECEWFWSWRQKTELKEDGYYYQTFGYERIRVPIDKWNGTATTWIPDESIINNLY